MGPAIFVFAFVKQGHKTNMFFFFFFTCCWPQAERSQTLLETGSIVPLSAG